MNENGQALTHPRNEREEAALQKTEEYKLDSYFLSVNNQKWLQNKLMDLERDFVEIINNVPAYYPTVLELCNIYRETGNRAKYREMLNYALKKFPQDDILAIMDAEFHYAANDFAAARKALITLTARGVRVPRVMKLLGGVYLNFKEKALAIESFKEYLRDSGGDVALRLEVIRMFFEAGDFINTLLELKEIPEREKNAELRKIEAVCLYYKEDYKKSLAVFTSIYRHYSDDIFTLMYLGDICFRLKKNYRAEYYWERALKIEPKTPEERAYAAKIHLFISEYDQAVKLVDYNFKKIANHYLSIFTMGLINLCEDKYHLAATHWLKVFREKRDLFAFEFELTKKSLKPERINEFLSRLTEGEYADLCIYIKERCDLR
ncbi:MAG: hypothetical protein ACD_47C00272G0001 [uncultured bacterium]|uniref:Uncharacterized protein n=1 Tax=Candidatus Wallbacteria bacterium GWC2_49_35 TaxID=1817813 RepID=A0A1F7WI52_9BACT|nr:MAG: hypothetical protein ACD_47C00272G0001 [uncultured bacterium]OGM02237.1 MAG: hypothetical protein A2008_09060 [Candidatus Wallbacteria bacterium GWC2_49_35]HBC74667.1 hypothetical protein [Candidatus Wallbacteria bacterium]